MWDPKATQEPWLLACVKAYALGDRLLAPGFCRTANNISEIKLDGAFPVDGWRFLVKLAFSILSSRCLILQSLVDTYCSNWGKGHDEGLSFRNGLSQEFERRVRRRFEELRGVAGEESFKKRCYLEHSSYSMYPTCPGLHFRGIRRENSATLNKLATESRRDEGENTAKL